MNGTSKRYAWCERLLRTELESLPCAIFMLQVSVTVGRSRCSVFEKKYVEEMQANWSSIGQVPSHSFLDLKLR